MNVYDAIPSPYIKGRDIIKAGGRLTMTIARATVEDGFVGKGQKKRQLVIYFKGTTKKLGLNKGNTDAIVGMYGEDDEGWRNQPITLYTVREYDNINKREIDAVRVSEQRPNLNEPRRNGPGTPPPRPSPPPAPPPAKPQAQPFPTVATKDLPPQPPELPKQPTIAEQLRDAKRAAWNKWIDRHHPIDAAEPPTKQQLDEMANSLKDHIKQAFGRDLSQLTIANYQALADSEFKAIDPQPLISDEPQVDADDIPF